jgi:hypothetical protein
MTFLRIFCRNPMIGRKRGTAHFNAHDGTSYEMPNEANPMPHSAPAFVAII